MQNMSLPLPDRSRSIGIQIGKIDCSEPLTCSASASLGDMLLPAVGSHASTHRWGFVVVLRCYRW